MAAFVNVQNPQHIIPLGSLPFTGSPPTEPYIGYDPKKANEVATHSMRVATWKMGSNDVAYDDLGEDWFLKRRLETHARRLVKQIESLDYSITIAPGEAA